MSRKKKVIRYEQADQKRQVYVYTAIALLVFVLVVLIFALIYTNERCKEATARYEEQMFNLTPTSYIFEELDTDEEVVVARYGFTNEEIALLAQLLCGGGNIDGDGEYDIDYQNDINHGEVNKVLSVVMNRVRHEHFPDTVEDVLFSPGQFTNMPRNVLRAPSDKALEVVGEWCAAYDRYDPGTQVVPDDHLYYTGDGFTNTTSTIW